MNFILTLLILMIILGVIITIHEFGHFIAAKKNGVYIDEFSIGMGPLIFKHKPKNSETTYSLRLLPVGGFVSMAEKEDPDNKKIKKNRVLENKNFWVRLLVLLNGIIFNCILAIFLFFISGLIYGKPVNTAEIARIEKGSAAYTSGLEVGDTIIKINGNNIESLDDFLLEASAKKLKDNYVFTVKKQDGSTKDINIKPEVHTEDGEEVRKYGIGFGGTTHKKGFMNAVSYAFEGFYSNTLTIIKIVGSLFTGDVKLKSLSGPVGIYTVIDQVKSQGFETLLYLTAYLSINVAIINLIPIPVFDGGRVLLLIIEKISRKKTNEKLEYILNLVGFGLMILLMIYVTFNDIIKLVVK